MRFLSLEPLLGPLTSLDLTGIDWVIVGGESGPRARPMDLKWARLLRDQCAAAGVAFYFKQAGSVLARQWAAAAKELSRPTGRNRFRGNSPRCRDGRQSTVCLP
ncbi:phage Gp37/Gp68 family protein [Mycobacterium xenopi 4042]|uniref:Phage Gp37/Gp68 family protein n=1 Tax=Mycobacterium xenopi 4042 TaxID=1299334 RepID=X8DCE9_MYCXE|nr:phage Gp37/Gp68 family protein [Mycobacterium xenopi 4042]